MISSIAGFAAVGALLVAAFTYRSEQRRNRFDRVMELIKESKNSEKIQTSLRILDDFMIIPKQGHSNTQSYYSRKDLGTILRDHTQSPITDLGELEIRESFGELLDFFSIIEYYLSSGVLRMNDLSRFRYYLQKAKDSDALTKFAKLYGYDEYLELIGRFNKKTEQLKT